MVLPLLLMKRSLVTSLETTFKQSYNNTKKDNSILCTNRLLFHTKQKPVGA